MAVQNKQIDTHVSIGKKNSLLPISTWMYSLLFTFLKTAVKQQQQQRQQQHTHTHTHTHIYIYIYIYTYNFSFRESHVYFDLNKWFYFPLWLLIRYFPPIFDWRLCTQHKNLSKGLLEFIILLMFLSLIPAVVQIFHIFISLFLMYIYIYIYIKRERKRKKEREREMAYQASWIT